MPEALSQVGTPSRSQPISLAGPPYQACEPSIVRRATTRPGAPRPGGWFSGRSMCPSANSAPSQQHFAVQVPCQPCCAWTVRSARPVLLCCQAQQDHVGAAHVWFPQITPHHVAQVRVPLVLRRGCATGLSHRPAMIGRATLGGQLCHIGQPCHPLSAPATRGDSQRSVARRAPYRGTHPRTHWGCTEPARRYGGHRIPS